MGATNCILLLLLLLAASGAISAGAPDTLGKGGNITGDETLVSAGGTFTMGFFSLGAPPTNKRYYLGIWFSVDPSVEGVCWVANSERPLSDKAGVLAVDTGSLVLRNGSGQTVWSSNTTTTSSSVVVQLLETGNLVVFDQGGGGLRLWQSFDHPSNTLLAGMKVGKNSWNGAEWHLTSWRSPDDPSPGPYRRVLDITSGAAGALVDFVVLNGNVTTYRTGPWNGLYFNGVPDVHGYKGLVTMGVTMCRDEISYGYTYTSNPGSNLTRLVLNEDGVVNRFVWNNSTREWVSIFLGPYDPCDSYGKCGASGLCDAARRDLPCGCLRGFSSPKSSSSSAWDSSACTRNVRLQCDNNGTTTDGFVLVKGVKLPDAHNASVDTSITMKECRSRCLANCSCWAYAAADIRGGSFPRGCVMWPDNIIDVRYVEQGQDMYLRLAKSELDKDFPLVPVVVASAASIIIAALALFLLIRWWRTKDLIEPAPKQTDQNPRDSSIPLAIIKSATRNFSTRNVIGEGNFGIVYKGKLPKGRGHQVPPGLAGRTIAIKRLKPISHLPQAKQSYFTREMEVMSGLTQHPNVLRLLAYCSDANERILIYEYMDRRSLDVYIFGTPKERALLNWQRRLQIIQELAGGVKHLHEREGSAGNVIHRDLKPVNVLLDSGWQPKVADFGTVKLLAAEDTGTQTMIGSPGYMAPEYFRSRGREVTLKCDVYSFGVTLLEILSGRQNGNRERQSPSLVPDAWRLWVDRSVTALLDFTVTPAPADLELAQLLRRCIQIGLLCVHDRPDDRPDMSKVVQMLSSSTTELDEPMVPMSISINNGVLADVSRPMVHEGVDII